MQSTFVIVLGLVVLSGCVPTGGPRPTEAATATATAAPASTPAPRRKPSDGTALAALQTLAVKGRAPKTGYDREQFGDGWVSINGCDTRQRILIRDLRRETFEPGSTCSVSPARSPTRTRRPRSSTSAAGRPRSTSITSSRWPTRGRRARSSGPPAAGRARQRPAEPARLQRRLQPPEGRRRRREVAPCEQVVPVRVRRAADRRQTPLPGVGLCCRKGRDARVLTRARTSRCRSVPASVPVAARMPSPAADGRVFTNCDAVRAAGRAPLRRGDPAYAAQLDGDNDGVACEP